MCSAPETLALSLSVYLQCFSVKYCVLFLHASTIVCFKKYCARVFKFMKLGFCFVFFCMCLLKLHCVEFSRAPQFCHFLFADCDLVFDFPPAFFYLSLFVRHGIFERCFINKSYYNIQLHQKYQQFKLTLLQMRRYVFSDFVCTSTVCSLLIKRKTYFPILCTQDVFSAVYCIYFF